MRAVVFVSIKCIKLRCIFILLPDILVLLGSIFIDVFFLFLKIIMANSLRRLRLDLHLVFAKAQ